VRSFPRFVSGNSLDNRFNGDVRTLFQANGGRDDGTPILGYASECRGERMEGEKIIISLFNNRFNLF
jgi:hypothetical protein